MFSIHHQARDISYPLNPFIPFKVIWPSWPFIHFFHKEWSTKWTKITKMIIRKYQLNLSLTMKCIINSFVLDFNSKIKCYLFSAKTCTRMKHFYQKLISRSQIARHLEQCKNQSAQYIIYCFSYLKLFI